MDAGYLEGVVRGYKGGILTQNHYANLTQCETIEGARYLLRTPFPSDAIVDFRMQLGSTDYGNFLANESLPISTSTISDKATQILVEQFHYMRSNAVEPLSKFLDYMTYVVY